jgi:membrane protease YdiL (CAAX protease family)
LSVPWRTREVALGIVLVAVGALLVSQAIVLLVGLEEDDTALIAWLTSISLGVAIFVIVWFLGLRPYRVSLAFLGLKPLGTPRLKVVGMTLGVLMLSLGATALYSYLVGLSGLEILLPPEIPSGIVFPGLGIVLTFLALAVWTPLTEEVFFRGFIFSGLSSRWGVTGAMVLSALIFSLFHDPLILVAPFNLDLYLSYNATGVLFPIFITGLLLAWLYRQTGSLWTCIAAHAGQNAAALAATVYGF